MMLKKTIQTLLLLTVVLMPITAHSLPKILEPLDKKHRTIKNKVIDTISTKENPWTQTECGYSGTPATEFVFVPEKYIKGKPGGAFVNGRLARERLTYTEYDFSNENQKINGIDEWVAKSAKSNSKYMIKKVILKTDNSELSISLSNGLDKKYYNTVLNKLIKTGDFKFVLYKYVTDDKLSQAQTDYWFEVFSYLNFENGKIENVVEATQKTSSENDNNI